jgi:alpha-L-fucosidase 2
LGYRGWIVSKALQDLLNRQAVNDETRTILREISPSYHLKRGLPPFLLIHGTSDKSVPLQQSLNFQKDLRTLNVLCELVIVPHTESASGKSLNPATRTKCLTGWGKR